MAYDEGLAERIRDILEGDSRILEKKMFGGIAFLLRGRMSVGIIRDELMVRVGPDAYEDAVALPHARAMDFTGRPMRGFVQVKPPGFESDADLAAWLARGIAYAEQQAKPSRRTPEPEAATRSSARGRSKREPVSRRTGKPGPAKGRGQ
jgi:TfoX/Sxy family transcriptional regulator of competence genes